jgi:hypothetical protein
VSFQFGQTLGLALVVAKRPVFFEVSDILVAYAVYYIEDIALGKSGVVALACKI